MQSLTTSIKGFFRTAILAGAVTLTVAGAAVTASEPAQAFEHADLRGVASPVAGNQQEGALAPTQVYYYGYRRFGYRPFLGYRRFYRPYRFGYAFRPYGYGFRRFGYRPYGFGYRRFY